MLENNYFVYILSNKTNTVLYVGMTNNIIRRLNEHRNKLVCGFTEKYSVNKLVYFELTNDVNVAIEREKQLKRWSRKKKDELIDSVNPTRKDLFNDLL